MRNEVISLGVTSRRKDSDGFETETLDLFECLAEIKSVGRDEFYAAAHASVKVSIIAVVNWADYTACKVSLGTPDKVQYDGVVYKVVRVYKTREDDFEMTLQEVG